MEEFGSDHWMHLFISDERLRLNVGSRIVVIKSRRSINDEALSFCHVMHEEEGSLTSTVWSSSSDRGESTCPRGAFNLDHYNSPDERLRLNHLNMNHRLIRCSHVPPRVSENWRSQLNHGIVRLRLRHVTCE